MSSVTSSPYDTPDAAQHRGYIDNGVNPGMVLTSFTTKPSSVRKQSTRASPAPPIASNARAPIDRISSVSAR